MKKLNNKQISVIAITAVVAVACVTTVSVKSMQKKNMTASLNDNINADVKNVAVDDAVAEITEETASEAEKITETVKKSSKANNKVVTVTTTEPENNNESNKTEANSETNYEQDDMFIYPKKVTRKEIAPISDETKKAIEQDFYDYMGAKAPDRYKDDYLYIDAYKANTGRENTAHFSYVNTYDGYIVGLMTRQALGYAYPDVVSTHMVGNKYLLNSDIYAWKDSKIYTMDELYDMGALSEESWDEINYMHGFPINKDALNN